MAGPNRKVSPFSKAYEHLTSKKGVGEDKNQAHGIKLVLKAHVCLYKQHWQTLSPYKYAGYPMLLDVLRGVGGLDMFQGEGAETMNHGLETVLLTMRSSHKNGEEFCRISGIFVLDTLLAQCVDVMTVNRRRPPLAQEAAPAPPPPSMHALSLCWSKSIGSCRAGP